MLRMLHVIMFNGSFFDYLFYRTTVLNLISFLLISPSGHFIVFVSHTFVRRMRDTHVLFIFRYVGLIANYALDYHFCVIVAAVLHCYDDFLSHVHRYDDSVFILLLLLMLYDLISCSIAVVVSIASS